ncbi:hypothetical protein HYDPIDRAFT_119797 [Hydnomerulius pinastri MD-312]|uniref:Anaphase-promoting complex subunit 4 WD40 domain-containing protein n=1 Tax=Hydnomerulius pinastri MD-312 TaxID=994086 RepID=A0A0C9VKY9_9AGAM|nr:hypothetical protein HYDPIDRAFT_119797 [Hydnomerulius pinastri MD-312]
MASSQTVVPEPMIESIPAKIFQGHENVVKTVAFFPGGDQIVTGDSKGEMRIWDVEEGIQDGEVLKGHTDWVRCVAVSRDRMWIGSGGKDNKVIVWDTTTREIKHTLDGHTNWVFSVDFSHDSLFLASGSDDKTARVSNVESGECVAGPITCNGIVYRIRFSPDNSRIATAADSIQIWNARTSDLELTIKESVTSLAWTNDGTEIIAGNFGRITIYDATTGDQLRRWKAHGNNFVDCLSLSPTSTLLASSSEGDKLAFVWDIQTSQQVATYQHEDDVNCIAYSPTGKFIATASNDHNTHLWEAPHPDEYSTLVHTFPQLPAVQISGEGEGISEVDRGDFQAGLYLDWPATARPTRSTPRPNIAKNSASGPSRSLRGIFNGFWTKEPRASEDIQLHEVSEGQEGGPSERTRIGGKVRMAASRMKEFYSVGARPYLEVKQVVTPVPPEFGGRPNPAPESTNAASTSIAPGTMAHAEMSQPSHMAQDSDDTHGVGGRLCCF